MPRFRSRPFTDELDATLPIKSGVWCDPTDASARISNRVDTGEDTGALEYLKTSDLHVFFGDLDIASDRCGEIADQGLIRFHFHHDLSVRIRSGSKESGKISGHGADLLILQPDHVPQAGVGAGRKRCFVTIAIEPDHLESAFGIRLADYVTIIDTSANGTTSHHAIQYNGDLSRVSAQILEHNLSGRLRSAYLAAKAQELLALTLHSLSEATQDLRQQLTERDVLAIQHARAIIEASITDVPDVAVLSRAVGVNRTKLFYGFKQIYGMSVTHYAKDFKMNRARQMLARTDLRISEIAQALGYEHSANFSTQFKSRFNCSPRIFRAQSRAI